MEVPSKEKLTVFFRVDSSYRIGTGHLMRCLTLAEEFGEKGAEAVFICRDHPGNSSQLVREKGFACYLLPLGEDPDRDSEREYTAWVGGTWAEDAGLTARIIEGCGQKAFGRKLLVVDHYGLDYRWERKLRPYVDQILVVDDLADRPHDCDFLLDQNLYENMEARYRGLVPAHCRLFMGPAYALIRKEFKEAKKKLKPRTGEVRRLLIFMGGTDPANETAKVLSAVEMLNRPDIAVDVVVGAQNPHAREIAQKCRQIPSTSFHLQTGRMAELMARADLAVGGGGTATWERCYMELPSLALNLAENQSGILETLHNKGVLICLGTGEKTTPEDIFRALSHTISNPSLIKKLIHNLRDLSIATRQVSLEIPAITLLLQESEASESPAAWTGKAATNKVSL